MFRSSSIEHGYRVQWWTNRPRSVRCAARPRGRGIPQLEPLEERALLAGTWTALHNPAPAGIGTMELLSNGTVMASGAAGNASNRWYQLSPNATGSYVNGTWSNLASMSLARLYDATNTLRDGRVFVLGGEYSGPNSTSNSTNTGEIYDPVANTWTATAPFPQTHFGDDPSMILPDGTVLAGYLFSPQTYIYQPTTNAWTAAATKLHSDQSDEETWVTLADGSILSYDVFSSISSGVGHAQRYFPSSNTWVDASTGATELSSSAIGYELGPGFLLPDGRAFYLGANGNTAFYTPSTNSWAAGPVIPLGQGADDAPGAMLPNGHILFAADTPLFHAPTRIYEFNPGDNSITDVTPSAPNLSNTPAYVMRMLMLPSGQVLFNSGGSQLYVYTPSGSAPTSSQPTISGVVPNGNNFTLTGTQLNGLSSGASYGDDAEMDTNYPIIELQNAAGTVYFARTFNWSSTGVATGSTPVTTDFSLPAGMPTDTYSLYVIANGIASAPYTFTGGGPPAPSADLAVAASGPLSGNEGDKFTYTLTVTNNGSISAAGVVLTDTLGANFKYISATTTQGTFKQAGSVVTISIGTLAANQVVTVTVVAQSTEDGILTNNASVTATTSDGDATNNTASVTTTVAEPAIVISAPMTTNAPSLKNNTTVATFTHAGGVEPASAFKATINWGDNTTSAGTVVLSGTSYKVTGSHTYPRKSGAHTITTTVSEVDNPPNPGPKGPHPTATTDGVPISATNANQTAILIAPSGDPDDQDPDDQDDADPGPGIPDPKQKKGAP